MSSNTNIFGKIAAGLLLTVLGAAANASYLVQVGYADNLRPSPFFPSPWLGDPTVDTFAGAAASIDAGAIRVVNTGSTNIVFDGLTVDSFGDGASFTLWNSFIGSVITAGHSMIFTQTWSYNFDTSDDEGSNPFAIPRVVLAIDGLTHAYLDTAQVLNTDGTDSLAARNLNESYQWREIGTYRGQAAVTEPTPFLLFGVGLVGLGMSRRRKYFN
jgi:hypothetical protein